MAKNASETIFEDLENAGFFINTEKSDFEPKQKGTWLGTVIDTTNMTFSVPSEKIRKLKTSIKQLVASPTCTSRELARIAGQLSAMHLALGSIVRLFTRHIYENIEERDTWYHRTHLTNEAHDELKFWLRNIDHLNGCTFKPRPTTSRIIFTDASDHGYGGFAMFRLQKLVCTGRFDEEEARGSSTFRELLAVKYMLQSFGNVLQNESLQVHIDNFSATRILLVGSTKKHLQNIAIDIFQHCVMNNIKLIPQWVPRDQNTEADYYSRINDTDDWGVDMECFNYISKRFGPFNVDRFADNLNKKVDLFNSKYYCPGTASVDAFTADWKGYNNWICPPISLIAASIRHLELCKAQGTLLIPVWESAYYWPLLYHNGLHLADFIKDYLVVNPYYITNSNSMFQGYQPFKAMAIRVSFLEN